ncbi:MAG: hypothetical protein H0Z33_11345 [Bacillaceae bacterium]|nr:hypothetical protein [Bacillaceae bacterium]
MQDTVRGVSIHASSKGLQYYVHYELAGTIEVDEKTYYQAVYQLEQWKLEREQQKRDTYVLNY